MGKDISELEDVQTFDVPDSDLPPLPSDDDSFLANPELGDNSDIASEGSMMMGREMKRRLMDIESSFLPEPPAHQDGLQVPGADDTYLFGGSPGRPQPLPPVEETHSDAESEPSRDESSLVLEEPPTPADAYKTPYTAVRRFDPADDEHDESLDPNTSISEPLPSSPSAQAAQRRVASGTASTPKHDDNSVAQATAGARPISDASQRPTSSASTVKAQHVPLPEEEDSLTEDHELCMEMPPPSASTTSSRISERPKYLLNRNASQRSSISSYTNQSDVSGDGGLDADYALQSGGAAPRLTIQRQGLSRLPSFGSIASSVSGYSDSNPIERTKSASGYLLPPDSNLERLEEEVTNATSPPATPRPSSSSKGFAPTDTVITRHVRDIQVPDTVAREYREKFSRSPEKGHMATPFIRSKHNLTLKEQNSKIDKLSKENFDLKLKIHFLDQALQNRSDEGVKEMISKNVQLQTDLANEKKENQALRKKVKDLERRLKAQEDGMASKDQSGSDEENSEQIPKQAELEEEILFLRERLEESDTINEQLQQDNLQREAEKRRMAEYIRQMGSNQEPSLGAEEAASIWQEQLEDERIRREQAEADAIRLREELQRVKEAGQQPLHQSTSSHVRNSYSISRRNLQSFSARSNSGSEFDSQGPVSSAGASSTLVEQLRHENAELRRDLGAQTSMLTSRNRERERLQQEIEGLKLSARRGDVSSVAGDSIFDRSVSRNYQRSVSRASGATRVTQLSDADRDDYESKLAALRDELLQSKMQFKELDEQLNQHLDLLEQAEAKIKEQETELNLQTQDLQEIQRERDETLAVLEDKEEECEALRREAEETIRQLEDEIEHREQECGRLVTNLENANEDFNALKQEMQNLSERLLQLEDDQEAALRKIQNLESELDDANQELGNMDKVLNDEKEKNERLEVQLESSQAEIDFLREEQEGDKIKIGELEASLNFAQNTIQDEKERFHDLEDRLAEERRQREILDSQEKQEVEKIITDLNTQLTKLKDENRKLRQSLSGKEVEAGSWKQRLEEMENDLREALGSLDGSRTSILKDIAKLQRDLDTTAQELADTKNELAEKHKFLRDRDALLESAGMDNRRLSDLLDRERQARRQDNAAFESAKRGHQSVARTIQQQQARIEELETQHSTDRRKLLSLDSQYKDQLLERNNLLYALWNRLSTLCGPEWSRNHAVINGELTSMELISKNISGFNKNMILAIKTIENIIGGFRARIRSIEKDLLRDYQTLEHSMDNRIKRLDHLEKMVLQQRQSAQSIGRPSTIRGGMVDASATQTNTEVVKLRTENKALRNEIQTLRAITANVAINVSSTTTSNAAGAAGSYVSGTTADGASSGNSNSKRASMAHTLLRHHSTSAVEHIQHHSSSSSPGAPESPYTSPFPPTAPLQPSEQKWIHRLKELERRLKAEREARLLDRSGARKRLEQKVEENEELRGMLERERERRASLVSELEGGEEAFERVSMLGDKEGLGSAAGSIRKSMRERERSRSAHRGGGGSVDEREQTY